MISQKIQSYSQYFQKLAADWTSPNIKQILKQRLKANSQNHHVQSSQQALSQQFYRSWLDTPMSNPLQRLVRHPLLTKQDKDQIDLYVAGQQQSQLKYASLFVSITLGLYMIFLRKSSFFQNFFNNRERRRVFNVGRKVLGVYSVFIGWMIVLNSHYQKKIPQGLNQKGLYTKYRILFQEKFV